MAIGDPDDRRSTRWSMCVSCALRLALAGRFSTVGLSSTSKVLLCGASGASTARLAIEIEGGAGRPGLVLDRWCVDWWTFTASPAPSAAGSQPVAAGKLTATNRCGGRASRRLGGCP